MTSRVLILGGASYVAQFLLARHLSTTDKRWVAACTLRGRETALPLGFVSAAATTAASDQSDERVRVYWKVDLSTMTGVRESVHHFRPDVVINCVALSSPAACEKEPARAKAINEASPKELVEFLDREVDWDVRLIHFSTDFVYDGASPPPLGYNEDDADADSSRLTVYGASKLNFDSYLLAKQSRISGYILRIANVLGPQAPLFRENQAPKFMSWLHQQLFQPKGVDSAPGSSACVKLWSDEVRSFIYVRDLVKILVALVEQGDDVALNSARRFALLNVGGIEALSRVQLAERYKEVRERLGSLGSGAVVAAIIPTSRATVDLGYHPPLDARLDTRRLQEALPALLLTPTAQFLDEICRELTHTNE